MITAKKIIFCASFFFLLLLVSCTTTKLKSVWKDNTYDGYINNIMVVGIFERRDIRKFFERELVNQFKNHDTEAIASADAIPSEEELRENVILGEARKQGIDMIMVTHLLSIDEKSAFHPQRNLGGFNSYYHWAYVYVHGPRYYSQGTLSVYLTSNLYETKTEKLIWSVTSKTMDVRESKYNIVKSLSKVVIKSLGNNKLLK